MQSSKIKIRWNVRKWGRRCSRVTDSRVGLGPGARVNKGSEPRATLERSRSTALKGRRALPFKQTMPLNAQNKWNGDFNSYY